MKSLNEPISDNEMYADYLKNGSFGIFWTVLIIGGLIEYALAFEKKYSNLKYDTNLLSLQVARFYKLQS